MVMSEIYYGSASSAGIKKIDKPTKGSWIHVINPSDEELVELSDNFNLELDLLQRTLRTFMSLRD
jgi:Mg2+ and Co2+ transporter CorA